MNNKKNSIEETRILEKTLESLEVRRQSPKSVYILLLLLYFAAAMTVSLTAGSQKEMIIGHPPVPIYTFAGIFSSFSNLCIIFLVIFCGKLGFITSVIIMAFHIPMILMGILVRKNYTSFPGLLVDILTLIAVIVIYSNIKKREEYQLRMREQATTDPLTKIPNGFACTELLNKLIRQNIPFAAVTIDINDFKSINDTMGFDMGNKVLVCIATRMKEIADKSLSGTLDFVSRINGDEFSLVVRNYRSEEDVLNTIRKYEAAITEKINIDGYVFFLIGFMFTSTNIHSFEALSKKYLSVLKLSSPKLNNIPIGFIVRRK